MDKGTKIVIIVLCGLLVLVFVVSFFQADDSTKGYYKEVPKETFHEKGENAPLEVLDKISVWKKASFDQRLTLCTAMTTQLNKDIKGERITVMDLHNCIEEATRGLEEANNLTIIQVASLCVSKLK
jgi:hypothetical protein